MAQSHVSPPHFTPLFVFHLLLFHLLHTHPPLVSAVNITSLLCSFPDLSDFNNLLTSSSLSSELSLRSSLTLLAVPNRFLRSSGLLHHTSTGTTVADILRFHVLLQYLSWPDFLHVPLNGRLVTTLFQTTGRATGNLGSVNITLNPSDSTVSVGSTNSSTTILSLVKTLPYNVSIFTVNSLLVSSSFDLMTFENQPPVGLNITKILIDSHNFNVAASMLTASGFVKEFEDDEGGAGITFFVPTDMAFADLPTMVTLQSLPADEKAVILKFHVLHSYYPLGSLESIVNPVQPTLATEDMGAGRFTLNITRFNGSLVIDTGIVQASITQTVLDQNPVSIFAVSRVLLPREIFGNEAMGSSRSASGMLRASPPEVSSPQDLPWLNSPPAQLSSPPDFREEIRSSAAVIELRKAVALLCILFNHLVY
ncbi:fasciclin-like arabinogalactan protein 4 [Telopea speciosissima]|uniref:fasciclin-like arabinogalactan protein 4 n=1 Tax=Telopea speciosissima TaxID=54955 RepID=UPI001CC5ACF6|nr:fasciclin-like arabinogalactan protein 4 [Telopea speciosissima]